MKAGVNRTGTGAATLRLSRPGLFTSPGSVRVWSNGDLFYAFDKSGPFRFTLPAGDYTVAGGSFVRPLVASDRNLPAPVPLPRFPKRIRVVFAPNPSRCSIHIRRGLIVCDPSLRTLPACCLTFVLFHEIGHYLYHGAQGEAQAAQEEACDRYAATEMLRRGWNPSQVAIASEMTLSDCSHARKGRNWEAMRATR